MIKNEYIGVELMIEALVEAGVEIPEDAMEYVIKHEHEWFLPKLTALRNFGVEIPERFSTGEKPMEYLESIREVFAEDREDLAIRYERKIEALKEVKELNAVL